MQSINRFVETIVGHIFRAFESQKSSLSLSLPFSPSARSLLFHFFSTPFTYSFFHWLNRVSLLLN